MNTCPLCRAENENVLWQNENLRIIAAAEANVPAVCRVIWHGHTAEMSDLPPDARAELMDAVWRTEAAMRAVLNPDKINLASLGNMVPHLHWHVIARFADDANFPAPIWAAAQRPSATVLHADWPQQVRAVLQKEAV